MRAEAITEKCGNEGNLPGSAVGCPGMRRAYSACHLVQKDECRGNKVAGAIQQASPAHRIPIIIARAVVQFNTACPPRLTVTPPASALSRGINPIR